MEIKSEIHILGLDITISRKRIFYKIKKTWGGPIFEGWGGDDNLSIERYSKLLELVTNPFVYR
jgi:hypothetical protein